MIKILTVADRDAYPKLFDQMFRGRARVFHERHGWKVDVIDGLEIDRYDNEEPIYLISVDEHETVLGSLRLLPTTGETMLQNEFRDFFDEPVDISSPTAWECTRFCIHPQDSVGSTEQWRTAASELLMELCSLALNSGIEHILGVYEFPMARIYKRIGWEPELLARSKEGYGQLAVGGWEVSGQNLERMRNNARIKHSGSPLYRVA